MKFKPLLGTDLSGHVGGLVASHNTYGTYFRRLVKPVNSKTPAQQAQRSALAAISQAWRGLGALLIGAWNAATVTKTSRKGDKVSLTGQAAFMYVNVLRRRTGLAVLTSPPSAVAGAAMTPPTVAFTSASTVTVTFNATDEWNASGGAVILSGGPLNSAGKTYLQPARAVTTIAFPAASPQTVTLPFAVAIGARVRIEFHATGPDGRQSTYVSVDATNPSYPSPAPTPRNVLEVTALTTTTALWRFDNTITASGGADANLQVGGNGALFVNQAGPMSAIASYTSGVTSGAAWSVTAQPTSITEPVLNPSTGTLD